MKDSLEFIIKTILGTNKVKVLEEESQYGEIILTIDSQSEDLGKIIGKKGKIINSIRKLIKIRAAKEGKRVFIKILDTPQNVENGFALPTAEEVETKNSVGS